MAEKRDWYLPDPHGNEAHGPFSEEQLAEQIRKGELRVDDFVWGSHFTDSKWRCFYELDEFKNLLRTYPRAPLPKKMNRGLAAREKTVQLNFQNKSGNYGDQNQYRRYPRAPMTAEIIIHNQNIYRKGVCIDISEKGLFMSTEDVEVFKKGEEVMVVVRNAPVIGTVAISSVVLRVSTSGGSKGYGVYFLRLNPQVRRLIATYVVRSLQGNLEEVSSSPSREEGSEERIAV